MKAELIPPAGDPVRLKRDVTVLGRDRAVCDIVIERDSVSALHAVLVKTDGLLFVRDLASMNGTHVNGQRITRGALLPGDKLRLGAVSFTVRLGPATVEAKAPDALPPLPVEEEIAPSSDEWLSVESDEIEV